MITVYTICFNEEFMLPHFIAHYRKMFPNCRIVVYDNQSTDATRAIALENGCEIVEYDTGGKLDDLTYLKIKNNCWKDAKTDWVLVADCDEFLDIDETELGFLIKSDCTVVRSKGFNMVNMNDDMNLESITHGIRSESYDKIYLFDKSHIHETDYEPGAHKARIKGWIARSYVTYRCRHYKYVNPDYMVARHKVFASRLSDENKKRGYGGHYLYNEEQIRNEFSEARKQAIKII